MPHILKTPDNRLRTPLSDTDLLALVEEYAGCEVRQAIEELIDETWREALDDH